MYALCSRREYQCLQVCPAVERLLQHRDGHKGCIHIRFCYRGGVLHHRRHAHHITAERHQHHQNEQRHSEERDRKINKDCKSSKLSIAYWGGAVTASPQYAYPCHDKRSACALTITPFGGLSLFYSGSGYVYALRLRHVHIAGCNLRHCRVFHVHETHCFLYMSHVVSPT